jgi:hypothetical protein
LQEESLYKTPLNFRDSVETIVAHWHGMEVVTEAWLRLLDRVARAGIAAEAALDQKLKSHRIPENVLAIKKRVANQLAIALGASKISGARLATSLNVAVWLFIMAFWSTRGAAAVRSGYISEDPSTLTCAVPIELAWAVIIGLAMLNLLRKPARKKRWLPSRSTFSTSLS